MKISQKQLKSLFFISLTAVMAVGTYNALIINSHSDMSGISSNKRLDEMFGDVKVGRAIAVEAKWQKLSVVKAATVQAVIPSNTITTVASSDVTPSNEAFIQESLELNLTEVVNPNRYKKPLSAKDFSGSVVANNGIIESLNVSIPGVEGISVAFGELSGNVFEYEHAGQVYSGLMYQVDAGSYMVTLTNGPLEGTRMRFNSQIPKEDAVEQNQQFLAETHNVEPGNFGSEEQEQPVADFAPNNSEFQNAGFNFEAKSI